MGLPQKSFRKNSQKIVIFLSALSLFCAITLDYISSKRGQSSYFFASSPPQSKTSPSPSLSEAIFSSLYRLGVNKNAIQHHIDNQNTLHVLVNLSNQDYSRIAPQLKQWLTEKTSSPPLTEDHQLGTTTYHLWSVSKDEDNAIILFQIPLHLSVKKKTSSSSLQVQGKNKVAIIIDDMGYSLSAIDSVCELGYPVSVAILPHSQFALETAQLAHQHGLEVLLHLPLEPLPGNHNSNNNPGHFPTPMIHSEMQPSEIIAFIDECLQHIPYVKGVNNHQGSLVTSNPRLMTTILQEIKKRGLFFVDSRTTNKSVAYQIAKSLNMAASYRKIFLDNEVSSPKIKEQFVKLLYQARQDGWAVAIGHPWQETLMVLKENKDLFSKYDCQPIFVSEIVD